VLKTLPNALKPAIALASSFLLFSSSAPLLLILLLLLLCRVVHPFQPLHSLAMASTTYSSPASHVKHHINEDINKFYEVKDILGTYVSEHTRGVAIDTTREWR
jgi:hypothetical protein